MKVLQESKYNAIKTLLNEGVQHKKIIEILNVSNHTIMRVEQSENYKDFTDYKKRAAINAEKKAHKAESGNQTVVRVEATHYMMQELQKTNELLTGISAKLAAIVSDLYGVKDNA